MLCMLDNYDSFTFNLVQYLGELGADVEVVRNDALTLDQLAQMKMRQLVVSPGPCTPVQAGLSVEAIKRLSGEVPILGVCLGHQCIGDAFGGRIVSACEIMHGKTSAIYHSGVGVFTDLPNPFIATRYHSLVIERASLPDCIEITAWTQKPDGEIEEIMGVRHRDLVVEGVQFHPESILSEHGHDLLNNFLTQTSRENP